jgi:hypothetical protein
MFRDPCEEARDFPICCQRLGFFPGFCASDFLDGFLGVAIDSFRRLDPPDLT